MGQTLTNGIYLPDEGERNSYSGLEANWRTLDALILTINGKAAPNVANTWTAAQTFTAGIAGDLTGNVTGNVTGELTGTASRAIADEDGTSIKTGYVNVAGNQTVSGQKTWSGNQFFTAGIYRKNTSYEIGNTPDSNVAIPIYFVDKANATTGYVRNTILTTGKTQSELLARNKFTSGALSPTGTDVTSTLQVEVQSNGDKTLYFDGSIRNNVLPYTANTYSLGSSSYQWSSVYAQSYYYNGTAWGLDKNNWWSLAQFYAQNLIHVRNVKPGVAPSSDVSAGIKFEDANASYVFADIVGRVFTSGTTFVNLIASNKFTNGALDPNGTTISKNLQIGLRADGSGFIYTDCEWRNNLVPHSADSGGLNLGTSTNKWKSLNGVNPGALSLPNKDNSVDITSEFTDLTGGDIFYIPPADGWITITADNEIFCAVVSSTHRTTFWCQSASATSISNACVTIPVKYLQHLRARIKSTNAITVTFYPCLGNV